MPYEAEAVIHRRNKLTHQRRALLSMNSCAFQGQGTCHDSYVSVSLCVFACVLMYVHASTSRGQRRASDPPKQEPEIVMSNLKWVLGTKLGPL